MKFRENWKSIIRDKFGIGSNIVVTGVDGDVDFCEQIFNLTELWHTEIKEIKLKINKKYINTNHTIIEGGYKKRFNNNKIDAYLTKEEFLDLVGYNTRKSGEDKEQVYHIESKLTNATIKDIYSNDYIQYFFTDEGYTNIKIGDKCGTAVKCAEDKNNDLIGLIVALMDAFGKSEKDKIKVSDILLGEEVEHSSFCNEEKWTEGKCVGVRYIQVGHHSYKCYKDKD